MILVTVLGLLLQGAPPGEGARPWHEEARAARALVLPALATEDLARWAEWIRPDPAELAFEELPWLASFAEGLRAAERAEKPLFLWAMNGHPLGCT